MRHYTWVFVGVTETNAMKRQNLMAEVGQRVQARPWLESNIVSKFDCVKRITVLST